jgi:hypothetical protein
MSRCCFFYLLVGESSELQQISMPLLMRSLIALRSAEGLGKRFDSVSKTDSVADATQLRLRVYSRLSRSTAGFAANRRLSFR